MPQTLHFKSHFLLSNHSLFFNPVVETNPFVKNPSFAAKFPFFQCSFSHSRETHIQKPIVCAKRTKRQSGYQRSTKFMLQLASIMASKMKILPQPLDLVFEEFNGGDGGGIGFLKGFGGGGGSGWWRRRRRKRNFGFMVVLLFLGTLFWFFGRESRGDNFFGVLGLGFFGVFLVKGLKRNVQIWIFGLCCIGASMGLRLRRYEARKLIDEFRVCASMVEILTKGKRRVGRRSS